MNESNKIKQTGFINSCRKKKTTLLNNKGVGLHGSSHILVPLSFFRLFFLVLLFHFVAMATKG